MERIYSISSYFIGERRFECFELRVWSWNKLNWCLKAERNYLKQIVACCRVPVVQSFLNLFRVILKVLRQLLFVFVLGFHACQCNRAPFGFIYNILTQLFNFSAILITHTPACKSLAGRLLKTYTNATCGPRRVVS